MIEEIERDGCVYAIIIRASFHKKNCIEFCTPNNFSQQLAYMNRPKGYVIQPHVHNPVPRNIHYTQEALFIRQGKLRTDFYDREQNYLESTILEAGDVILLTNGGHGFEVLEEIDMVEVKQGPYAGEADKTRFKGIDVNQLVLEGSFNV